MLTMRQPKAGSMTLQRRLKRCVAVARSAFQLGSGRMIRARSSSVFVSVVAIPFHSTTFGRFRTSTAICTEARIEAVLGLISCARARLEIISRIACIRASVLLARAGQGDASIPPAVRLKPFEPAVGHGVAERLLRRRPLLRTLHPRGERYVKLAGPDPVVRTSRTPLGDEVTHEVLGRPILPCRRAHRIGAGQPLPLPVEAPTHEP